ncbi:hypothetical protein [Rhizobium sp. ICMP 5592]|uniref:hypothetical protein n=1 Tax=Rhizobium sp. ICMP 5592 TaxID=2292445 RepID=UPI001297716A|nr:hypothetical protein [Rhizobium sp. ICMP 5592]MQB43353.1 hypothetical protein [Rhizobium sp. ICMP 5592]
MSDEKTILNLVVTRDGVPLEDQAEGIRQFKEACLFAAERAKQERIISAQLASLEFLPAKLLTGPHGSFHLNYNDGHAVQYQTAAEYFASFPDQDLGWISAEERDKAISSNSVWTVQWYPKNPISHYVVRGSTAAAVLAAALKEQAKEAQNGRDTQ